MSEQQMINSCHAGRNQSMPNRLSCAISGSFVLTPWTFLLVGADTVEGRGNFSIPLFNASIVTVVL